MRIRRDKGSGRARHVGLRTSIENMKKDYTSAAFNVAVDSGLLDKLNALSKQSSVEWQVTDWVNADTFSITTNIPGPGDNENSRLNIYVRGNGEIDAFNGETGWPSRSGIHTQNGEAAAIVEYVATNAVRRKLAKKSKLTL